MRTRFSIDTATGAISRFNLGAPVPPALVLVLTARDILECEVVFTAAGEDVTTQILGTGVLMRLGLRQNTSDGPLLAVSDPYTLDAGVAKTTWSLNTQEIVDLVAALPLTARNAKVYFECEIEAEDGSYRETLAQAQATLQCEVNMEADETPAAAAASAATAAAQAAIATTQAGIATTKATQTTADAAQTAADRVQTGIDRAASASSATAAQNAVAGAFLGLVAGTAVPATAPAAGRYYIISSAGTSQSITWSFGDWAIYNGTSGSWSRLAAGAVDRATLDAIANASAPMQAIDFDGLQTQRTAITLSDFGDFEFGIFAWVFVNQIGPAHAIFGPTGGSDVYFAVTGTGALGMRNGSATQYLLSASTISAGAWYFVGYTRSGGIGTFWINGKTAGSGVDTYTWGKIYELGAAASTSVDKLSGAISRIYIFNRAPSADEVTDLFQTKRVNPRDIFGAGTPLVVGNDSTFASDSGWWQKYGSTTISGGAANIPNGSNLSTPSILIPYRNKILAVRATFTGTITLEDGSTLHAPLTSGKWVYVTVPGNSSQFFFSPTGAVVLDTVEIVVCGALTVLDSAQPGAGGTWYAVPGTAGDVTGIDGTHVRWTLPSSGVIPGTMTNDNAPAGARGEYVSSTVASGSAIGLTNNVPANVTSIVLTAGDWDVEGHIYFGGTLTGTKSCASISTVSNAVSSDQQSAYLPLVSTSIAAVTIRPPTVRFSLATTTTIYLVAQASFSAGIASAWGGLCARRAR